MLTSEEIKALEKVNELNTKGCAILKNPMRSGIKSLIERGYLKTSRALSGPLGIPTGETAVKVTEAGKIALHATREAKEEA